MGQYSAFSLKKDLVSQRCKNVKLKLNFDCQNYFMIDVMDIIQAEKSKFDLNVNNVNCGNIITSQKEGTPNLTEYASGTDQHLSNPSDNSALSQNDNYLPGCGSYATTYIFLNTYRWVCSGGLGGGRTITGQNQGTSYGSLRLQPYGSWLAFDGSSSDGIQRIWFPKTTTNDKLGGYVDFYFNSGAFYTAFDGTSSNIIITIDGSVFKGGVSLPNLVVTGDGMIGLAGGGSLNPYLNMERDNIIKQKFGDNVVATMNISKAKQSIIKGVANNYGTKTFEECENLILHSLVNSLATLGNGNFDE